MLQADGGLKMKLGPAQQRLHDILSDGAWHSGPALAAALNVNSRRVVALVSSMPLELAIERDHRGTASRGYRLLTDWFYAGIPADRHEELRHLVTSHKFSADEARRIILDDMAVQERRKRRAA